VQPEPRKQSARHVAEEDRPEPVTAKPAPNDTPRRRDRRSEQRKNFQQ